jgi:hypothetical protein
MDIFLLYAENGALHLGSFNVMHIRQAEFISKSARVINRIVPMGMLRYKDLGRKRRMENCVRRSFISRTIHYTE